MKSRLELQTMLETLLGSRNVYFQPPESIKLQYPAIVYTIERIGKVHASNAMFKRNNAYQLTYIDKDPDSENVDKLLQLQYCEFDRQFTSDNLNHYIFTLYY